VFFFLFWFFLGGFLVWGFRLLLVVVLFFGGGGLGGFRAKPEKGPEKWVGGAERGLTEPHLE